MTRSTLFAIAAQCGLAAAACAQPAQFQVNGVPDFSQKHNGAWRNFCAPTVGADWVYYYSTKYPALRQGNPLGPGGAADTAVDIIIGIPPALPPTSIAGLMGTTTATGTTLNGCAIGLDNYLELNDGKLNVTWNTAPFLIGMFPAPSGQNMFLLAQQTLATGGAVILAIHWNAGVPAGYDLPDNYVPLDSLGAPMGHAMALTGYRTGAAMQQVTNDPANNVPVTAHNWPGENLVSNIIGLPVNWTFLVGGVQATVYGMVVTTPVIGPCPWDLNGDKLVTTADLTILLGHFGQAVPAGTLGDLNGDAVVNTVDLTMLLGAFGGSCA